MMTSFVPVASAVHPPVRAGTPHGVSIVVPHTVAVNQRALARTVRKVFDCRDLDDRLRGHSRADPNALVVSDVPVRWNATVRHAACTPTCGHLSLRSGFQQSKSASMPSLPRDGLHAGQQKLPCASPPSRCRQPLCRTVMSARRSIRISVPTPRTGRRARPKKASTSTTGSTQGSDLSDNDPSLPRSNPNPLPCTRSASPASEFRN